MAGLGYRGMLIWLLLTLPYLIRQWRKLGWWTTGIVTVSSTCMKICLTQHNEQLLFFFHVHPPLKSEFKREKAKYFDWLWRGLKFFVQSCMLVVRMYWHGYTTIVAPTLCHTTRALNLPALANHHLHSTAAALVCGNECTYRQARCSGVHPSLFVHCILQCCSVIRCFTTSKWPSLYDSERWYLTVSYGVYTDLAIAAWFWIQACIEMVTKLVKMYRGCDGKVKISST